MSISQLSRFLRTQTILSVALVQRYFRFVQVISGRLHRLANSYNLSWANHESMLRAHRVNATFRWNLRVLSIPNAVTDHLWERGQRTIALQLHHAWQIVTPSRYEAFLRESQANIVDGNLKQVGLTLMIEFSFTFRLYYSPSTMKSKRVHLLKLEGMSCHSKTHF